MTEDYLTKLIDDHWAYIEGILRAHALGDPDINLAKYHYKTAFRHGYKHAREDADADESRRSLAGYSGVQTVENTYPLPAGYDI